jgi:type II secretory pathway pseudopilin PulG
MMRAWRDRRLSEDDGISLVEVIVSTLIFAIILTVITATIVTMFRQVRVQTGQTNDLTAARNVVTKLDHQVRYANAVSTPGTGTDGSYYVEFRTGNLNQQQTCTQWRFVPVGGAVQYRTWLPLLAGVGSTTPSGWNTVGVGFSLIGATPFFSITPASVAQSSVDTHYALTVAFNASSGAPAVTSQSQVTITAINSTRNPASPTPSAVCTENGRP